MASSLWLVVAGEAVSGVIQKDVLPETARPVEVAVTPSVQGGGVLLFSRVCMDGLDMGVQRDGDL